MKMRHLFSVACALLIGCSGEWDATSPGSTAPITDIYLCRITSSGDPFAGEEILIGNIEVLEKLTSNKTDIEQLNGLLSDANKSEQMEAPFVGYKAHYLAVTSDGTPAWVLGQIDFEDSYSLQNVDRKSDEAMNYFISEGTSWYFDSRSLSELLERIRAKAK